MPPSLQVKILLLQVSIIRLASLITGRPNISIPSLLVNSTFVSLVGRLDTDKIFTASSTSVSLFEIVQTWFIQSFRLQLFVRVIMDGPRDYMDTPGT